MPTTMVLETTNSVMVSMEKEVIPKKKVLSGQVYFQPPKGTMTKYQELLYTLLHNFFTLNKLLQYLPPKNGHEKRKVRKINVLK